jgi:predicted dithiol-disulfide oxidoreductase (DUF899 family)
VTLAAERRRMPWVAVEKKYEFDGPQGKVSLLDLFEGRLQLDLLLRALEGDEEARLQIERLRASRKVHPPPANVEMV